MKKWLIIGLMAMFAATVSAQLPVSLGIKVGINSPKFTVNKMKAEMDGNKQYNFNDFTSDFKSGGFTVGLMSRVKFGKFFLQPEAYYSLKKGETTGALNPVVNTDPTGSITQHIKMQNIDVPILLGVRLLDLKVFKVNAFTGPVASLNVSNEVTFTKQIDGQASTDVSDVKLGTSFGSLSTVDWGKEFKNANWNWQIGAGFDLLMFYADVRYEMGMSEISKFADNTKSKLFTFTLGYKFF